MTETVTQGVAADSIWNAVPPQVRTIASGAKDLIGVYSDVQSGLAVASAFAQALGFIGAPETDFTRLREQLNAIAVGLDWKISEIPRAEHRGTLMAAIDAARNAMNAGTTLPFTSAQNSSSTSAVYAAEEDVYFTRYLRESATDGHWKWVMSDRPERSPDSGGDLVYDWRQGVPDLMKLIAMRLEVMPAVDRNFLTNTTFDGELRAHRAALIKHRAKMWQGIRCGTRSDGSGWLHIACADIYTGTAAYKNQYGYACWPTPINNVSCLWDQAETARIQESLFRQVLLTMPLFELRSMIDTLYLLETNVPDLTRQQRIPMESNQGLCIDVQWGNPAPGTPVWLWPCTGNDAQKWRYNRRTGTVYNPAYDRCLDVWGENPDKGTPVQIYYCHGGANQKWTYDPERKVLTSALSTVLDAPSVAQSTLLRTWGELSSSSSKFQALHAD